MREISIDGKNFSVRALTRAEIRKGQAHGFGYARIRLEPDNFDEACDYALGCQFEAGALDALSNPGLLALFQAVLAETYGTEEEEKN